MNKLIIDDYPLLVLPKLAKEIGLNEAIFVQQLHYWTNGKSGKPRDGRRWIYNTYDEWQEQFPFWSVSTIRRTISSCEKANMILVGNYNKLGIDNTKWYSVNYETLKGLSRPTVQNEQTECSKWTDPSVQNGQTITRDLPEITTETNNSPAKAERPPFGKIIDYLNKKAERSFKHTTSKTQSMINARYNEGFAYEDFKTVIDNKVNDWLGDKNMSRYLRPETLFGTKFESYLNETPATPKDTSREVADF